MEILTSVKDSQQQLEWSKAFPAPVHLFMTKLLEEGSQQPTILQTARPTSRFLRTRRRWRPNVGWYGGELKRGGKKSPWKKYRICTNVRRTNKPNITGIQNSVENAERFNSPSSLVAEKIKARVAGGGGGMNQSGRQRHNRLRVINNSLLGPSSSYHTHKLWMALQDKKD